MASAAQTVVFDLDGTLTDSQAGVVASYGHALAGWGIEVDGDAIRPWLGPPLRDGFLALGVRPAEVERAIQRYREYFSTQGILENQLYPGIVAMLATLSKTGLTVAVATSKLEEYALRILDQFSISTYFRVVVGSSADGTRVHKDEILEHALKNLGSPDPATTVMSATGNTTFGPRLISGFARSALPGATARRPSCYKPVPTPLRIALRS